MSANAPTKLTIKDYKSELHNDWCPGCITPTTPIVTPTGLRPIVEIAVGDEVLAHDGRYHRVTEVMSHAHPAPLHHVSIDGLGTAVLTADHPMYVARIQGDRVRLDWVAASEVRVGDEIAYTLPLGAEVFSRVARADELAAGSRVATLRVPKMLQTYVLARVVANE